MIEPVNQRHGRNRTSRTPKKPRTFTHAHRQRFDRAADHYLRRCYRTKSAARASEFATELELTPEYVSRLAHQILGKSLRDFLREKQVMYAARLLKATPASVTIEEIALQAGFGTAATLYRWFSATYGMTPGVYREVKK